MKKFIIATLAISVLATSAPVMAAPDHGKSRSWHDAKERRDDRGSKHDRRDNRRDDRRNDRGYFHDARRDDNRRPVVVVRKGPPPHARGHAWRKGERFDHRRAPRYVVINNPRHYHLHDAPRGYRWVRSGNDAVLVGITTGIVAAVVTSVLIN